jgi:hypothetical protein
MDITPEKVLKIQQYARERFSLDQTIGDEGASQLGDFIEDSEAVVAIDAVFFTLLKDQLRSVLATLSAQQASIVELRYGLTDDRPRTLDEISHVHGVTQERIRSTACCPVQWPGCTSLTATSGGRCDAFCWAVEYQRFAGARESKSKVAASTYTASCY